MRDMHIKFTDWVHTCIVLHAEFCEIRGLRSTKCSRKMLQNLPYFVYKKRMKNEKITWVFL